MSDGIPCMLMRGGTSKGPFFLAKDLPAEPVARNALLLKIMGSPDARQIDGIGGAHPLASKVAIVSPSQKDGCDVDYLFLQVTPNTSAVSDSQNCGNMLAGVGPFSIERGLVQPTSDETLIKVFMVNSESRAELIVKTPSGRVTYDGDSCIDGVPGEHAPIMQYSYGTAGAQCGALLPTGNAIDEFMGIECTLIDNGMPSVILRASDVGCSGYETPAELENKTGLKEHIERIRLWAGKKMGLGDVTDKTIPKMCLISPPRNGGLINTRTFIPHRVHQAVGVLAAATDAAGCMVKDGIAKDLAVFDDANPCRVNVEHPTGALTVELEWKNGTVVKTGLLRTARKLMDGKVYE